MEQLPEFTADMCIKCNICTASCPVAAVTDLFPGPKTVGPQAQRFRKPDSRGKGSPDKSVDYCSGCGVCTMVCPHGVHVMEMNARARAALYDGHIPLRNRILGRSELLGKIGHPVSGLANMAMNFRPMRILAEKIIGIHRDAPFPKWAPETFRSWAKRHISPPGTSGKVVLFHGCAGNYYEPWVIKAAVAVLEHNGYEVVVPQQNCCGLPLISNGEFDAASAYAERNLKSLAPYAEEGIPIIGVGTSCTLTLKSDYREILGLRTPESEALAAATYDISEFLLLAYERGDLKTDFVGFEPEKTALYHAQCQLRAHKMGLPALELLRMIPGLKVFQSDAVCCGIAGTYGYKVEKHEISMAIGEPLFTQAAELQPDVIACGSETCRWHIEANTGIRTVHPVEILAAAYGFMGLGEQLR